MQEISQSTLQFIRQHRNDNPARLALTAAKNSSVDMAYAVTQIAGRQAAAQKLPSWAERDDIVYPRHLSMEQCSSEATARYKASLVGGEAMADLTGGFGVDCYFMAQGFRRATYIERQEELCHIAAHNFAVLGSSHISAIHGESIGQIDALDQVDWIFIDPARRNEHGGKTVQIADCEPDVSQLEDRLLLHARHVMVKLSPMLDISLACTVLKHVSQVHIVSVAGECKELLLVLSREAESTEARTFCVNIAGGATSIYSFSRSAEQQAVCEHSTSVERYLYEPNASVMKAGAFRSVAASFGLKKLHPNSHLYTADTLHADFPGRVFVVTAVCSLGKRDVKATLADVSKANISVRNFPATVAELRKRLRLADGGDVYLFATTLADGSHVMVRCEKPKTNT
jgi:hypothetical protein